MITRLTKVTIFFALWAVFATLTAFTFALFCNATTAAAFTWPGTQLVILLAGWIPGLIVVMDDE